MIFNHRGVKVFLCVFILFAIGSDCCAKNFISSYREKRRIKKEKKHPVNRMPKTIEEYLEQSKELKTSDLKIEEPKFPKNPKVLNEPEIEIKLTPYNTPAGSRTIDLSHLRANGYVHGQAVATPSGDKLVYTELYYDKVNKNVKSEVYTILNAEHKSTYDFLKTANVALKIHKPILTTGIPVEAFAQQNVLTPIDWSKDGKKIAIKETIGNNCDAIWKTNIWVYDYGSQSATELIGLRREIINWWLVNKNLNLNDYFWDIFPLGWSGNDLVVVAYILQKDKKLFFLGEWKTDTNGNNIRLVSQTQQTTNVEANGVALKFERKY